MSLRAELHAFVDRIADELEKSRADEWVDQASSPLGRDRHLRLAREGALPSSRDGRLVLIRRSDIDTYLAQRRTPAKVDAPTREQRVAERAAKWGGR